MLAALRIVGRDRALRQDKTLPLGIYKDGTKGRKYLTGQRISEYFRFIATEVHELTDPSEAALYSAHSMRVTAAVMLHQVGKTPEYIKIRLRWVSNAFESYLRNTDVIMDQHVDALAKDSANIHGMTLHEANIPALVSHSVGEDLSSDLVDEEED